MGNKITFKTWQDKFLRAEDGGAPERKMDGLRRMGRVNGLGPDQTAWQTWEYEDLGDGYFAFKSSEGFYLCDENGLAWADRKNRSDWERWKVLPGESKGTIALQSHTGKFLTIEQNGEVHIDRVKVAQWESLAPSANLLKPAMPTPSGDLTSFPRRGVSIYGLLTDSAWDFVQVAEIIASIKFPRPMTRFWLLSALWPEVGGDILLPFSRVGDRMWDLYDWNARYEERLARIVTTMNSYGIICQIDVTELYGWSRRKQGMPGVPDPSQGPWRGNNINGVNWNDDDAWFTHQPTDWLNVFIRRAVKIVKSVDGQVLWEPGNEMPEKDLQKRIRDVIRAEDPGAQFSVNRNEDVPGQYMNMEIGHEFDRISFHGKKNMGFFDEVHDNGQATDRPDTFRKLLDGRVDNSRIIFSSDGCRASMDPVNAYDWNALLEVAKYVIGRGCSFEHQSGVKLERIRSGRPDLNFIEIEWLKKLAAV